MVIHYTVLVYMPVLLYVNTTQKPYTHTVLVHTRIYSFFHSRRTGSVCIRWDSDFTFDTQPINPNPPGPCVYHIRYTQLTLWLINPNPPGLCVYHIWYTQLTLWLIWKKFDVLGRAIALRPVNLLTGLRKQRNQISQKAKPIYTVLFIFCSCVITKHCKHHTKWL